MVVCGDINAKSETRRVPCPYDPSHSVYLHRLKAHMEKLCNARPPATRPAHTVPDCNVALLPPGYAEGSFSECGQLWAEEGLAKADTRLMVQPGEHAYLGTTNSKLFGDLRTSAQDNLLSATAAPLTEATTHRLLRPVVSSYLRSLSAAPDNIEEMGLVELLDLVRPTEDLPLDICTHSALDERRLLKTNAKHVLQQASLLGHLDKRGLLDAKYAFIEFGAGKGELSVYLHAALGSALAEQDSCICLVDRKNFRQKFSVAGDGDDQVALVESSRGHFTRIHIDIRDLDLAKVAELQTEDKTTGAVQLRPIVAYSKHLCGAATDLTIRCLERYQQAGGTVAGIAIALCCHQACKYSMYVDHEYLSTAMMSDSGAGRWGSSQRSEFRHLMAMSSWAINAPAPPQQQDPQQQQQRDGLEADPAAHCSGLTFDQRVRAGHAVKRFIDIGRAAYVRRALSMNDVELVYYTTRSTSPENLALLGTKAAL